MITHLKFASIPVSDQRRALTYMIIKDPDGNQFVVGSK